MPLIAERRDITYTIVLGVWGMVAVYAILHDQYIVLIAPEHFTKYHPPLWDIGNPALLALIYAARSSLAPGLLWGLVLARAARHGDLAKVPVKVVLKGSAIVILLTELLAAVAGLLAWKTGDSLLPQFLYPDDSLPMRVTTTIQWVCYLAGALLAGAWTVQVTARRRRKENAPPL